jgi:predicted nucleic acid-binding protein
VIFVDTSYLIALFEKSDALHARARQWGRAIRVPLLISEFILVEAYNHFSRPFDRPKVPIIHRAIMTNARYEVVSLSSERLADGLEYHRQRPDKEWSMVDCISFRLMKERGVTQALTHDQHFEQAGFEALLRRDP